MPELRSQVTGVQGSQCVVGQQAVCAAAGWACDLGRLSRPLAPLPAARYQQAGNVRSARLHPLLGKVTQGQSNGPKTDDVDSLDPSHSSRLPMVSQVPASAGAGAMGQTVSKDPGPLRLLRPNWQQSDAGQLQASSDAGLAQMVSPSQPSPKFDLGEIYSSPRAIPAPGTEDLRSSTRRNMIPRNRMPYCGHVRVCGSLGGAIPPGPPVFYPEQLTAHSS